MEKKLFTYQVKPRKSKLRHGEKVDMETYTLVVDAKNKKILVKNFQGNMGGGFGGRGASYHEDCAGCSVETFQKLLNEHGTREQRKKYQSFNGDNWEIFL